MSTSSTSTETVREGFALVLDPSVPLEEQVQRGNYNYANPAITQEHFSLTLSGGCEVVLFDPHGTVSSEEMVRRMKQDGYVPATLDDALAMGTQFPERQRQNPIVFLGSVWRDGDGSRRVPVLFDWSGERGLGLGWFVYGWSVRCRFAAVRES